MLAFACMIVTCAGLFVPCLWLRYIEGVEKNYYSNPLPKGLFNVLPVKIYKIMSIEDNVQVLTSFNTATAVVGLFIGLAIGCQWVYLEIQLYRYRQQWHYWL